MRPPIELRKIRDFGEVINTTFTFLKENIKPLFTALFAICGFFLFLEALSSIFTYAKLSDIFNTGVGRINPVTGLPLYTIGLFVNLIVAYLAQVFINMVTICYISVYVQKNNTKPTLPEVWGYFKYYFFRAMGSGLLVTILFLLGFVACCIGELALMPYLGLVLPIIIIENSTFSYAFNKSFRLVKNNWWYTFGIIVVIGVIIYCCNLMSGIPLTLINTGQLLLSLKSLTLPLVIIFSMVKSFLILTYTLATISICLCYFSLVEEKDGTGLRERIEYFGKPDLDTISPPAEEY